MKSEEDKQELMQVIEVFQADAVVELEAFCGRLKSEKSLKDMSVSKIETAITSLINEEIFHLSLYFKKCITNLTNSDKESFPEDLKLQSLFIF